MRVTTTASIAGANVRVQVNIGFGDAITPSAELVEFPALLEFDPPRLRAYPRETVIAEKLEAMVQLGMANSRMKDFFDVLSLAAVHVRRSAAYSRPPRDLRSPRHAAAPASPCRADVRVRERRDQANAVEGLRAKVGGGGRSGGI